jgi:hypothetical protein
MKIYKQKLESWYLERIIFFIGGLFTLASVLLGMFWSEYAFYFTGLVGLMQIIFALTGYCPMAILLNSLGVKEK